MNIEKAQKIIEGKGLKVENSVLASKLIVSSIYIDDIADFGKELLRNELDFEYEASMGILIDRDDLKAIAELIELIDRDDLKTIAELIEEGMA